MLSVFHLGAVLQIVLLLLPSTSANAGLFRNIDVLLFIEMFIVAIIISLL